MALLIKPNAASIKYILPTSKPNTTSNIYCQQANQIQLVTNRYQANQIQLANQKQLVIWIANKQQPQCHMHNVHNRSLEHITR